jgi:ribosomal subunit interface protein
MQVQVSGQNLDIGSSLREYVTTRLEDGVNKYFGELAIKGHVNFAKKNKSQYYCDIYVNEGTKRNVHIKSQAYSEDIYSSFDLALTKAEKQLRRYKSKLQNHAKTKTSEAVQQLAGTKYVIDSNERENVEQEDENNGSPAIVAEDPTTIENLSVDQAVMKMDLESLPALMFKNVKTGRFNVVYYRSDGNISWVDTKAAE